MAEINGKYEEINDVNLLDYLIENKYRVDRVVIDLNGDIVKKADFEKINIKKLHSNRSGVFLLFICQSM